MYLIASVANHPHATPSFQLRIHALAHLGLNLRDAVSLFSRQTLTPTYVDDLKRVCTVYFNICSMFINSVTPTVWTIGHAIPYHAEILKNKFNLGLRINTMQGRGAKHIEIAKYAEHSLPSNRWSLTFRHEYISTFYDDPHANMFSHIDVPKRVDGNEFCYCGFPKLALEEKCQYCSDPLRCSVAKSAESGKLDLLVCQLLSTTA